MRGTRVARRGGDLTATAPCDLPHGATEPRGCRDRRGRTRSGPPSGGQTGTRPGPHGAGGRPVPPTALPQAPRGAHGPPSDRHRTAAASLRAAPDETEVNTMQTITKLRENLQPGSALKG